MKQMICTLIGLVAFTTARTITPITSQASLEKTLEDNVFVVLGIYAKNHGLSKFIKGIGEKAEESSRPLLGVPVKFINIDFDENRDIANRYHVKTAATYLFFKNKVVVGRTGAVAIASPNNRPKKMLAKMQKAFKISEDEKIHTVEKLERKENAQVSPTSPKVRNVPGKNLRRD